MLNSVFITAALLSLSGLTSATPTKRADAFLIKANVAGKCLGTYGFPYNGIGLSNLDCDAIATGSQGYLGKFEIVKGNNPNGIRLTGTNYCLDAGPRPNEAAPLQLWTCYPGLTQQTFYYTDDKHIAVTGGNQCLDYASQGCGRFDCSGGFAPCANPTLPTNQLWDIVASSPVIVAPPNPPGQTGVQIHPAANRGYCIYGTIFQEPKSGVQPFVDGCVGNGVNLKLQYFEISRGQTAVKLTGYNLCLDTGANPQNGALAKWETCNGGPTQNFWYTDAGDDHIAVTGGVLCLDLKREDGRTLQYWQCDGGNIQQKFVL